MNELFTDTLPTATEPVSVGSIKLIGSVEIPAIKQGFDPKELLSTKKGKAIANFYHLRNFEEFLYDNSDKIASCPSFKLNIYQTIRSTTDYEIMSQTKAKPLSETEFFVALVYLISKQPNAEPGILLTSGYANIFHVGLKSGAAVAASAGWRSWNVGWDLDARDLGKWIDGPLVFSRGI